MPSSSSLSSRWRHSCQEAVIGLALLIFFLWVRIRTLEPIEIGGDAIQKWWFVRGWAYRSPFDGTEWNHHFTRMGDNVPVYLIQRVLGTAPWVYYVGPVLAFVVAAWMVYLVGKRVSGRFTGVVAAIVCTMFGPMRRAASQMVPSAFSCMYVMLGTYFLVRYVQDESRVRWRWLVPCALSLFGGYLSHETNIFFVPAFALVIWSYARDLRPMALFLGILLGGFLLETAMYASLTEFPSRLHVTKATHLSGASLQFANVWGLLDRFRTSDFGPDFRRQFYVWPVAAVGLAALARDRLTRLFPLLPFSFLFLMTFLVRSIDPIRTFMSFQSRYLVVGVPLIVLTNVLFLMTLAERVVGMIVALRSRGGRLRPMLERTRATLARVSRLDVVWVLLLLLWMGKQYYPQGGLEQALKTHPLVTWRDTQAMITDAYRRGLPIIGPKKSIRVAYYVFIDEATLLEHGRLPPVYEKVGAYDKNRVLLAADPSLYMPRARRRVDKKCALELRRNGRFLVLPRRAVPASCQPPAAGAS